MNAASRRSAGKRFGGYEIVRLLRKDGGVYVYQATQLALGRHVRLSVLPVAEARKADNVLRFEREMHAVSQLRHDNVLGALDAGSVGGHRYVATEDVAGKTLRDALTAGRTFEVDEALAIAHSVARALDCFESAGYVHRNVLPRAIVLTDSGVTKLAGLSRAKQPSKSPAETWFEIVDEDAPYRAPEVAKGSSRYDVRGDIYSLGCVLYELLAGRPPFRGASSGAILAAHIRRAPRPIRFRRPDVPEAAERIALNCLQKSRADRYQHAAEVLGDIDRARAGTTVRPLGDVTRRRR